MSKAAYPEKLNDVLLRGEYAGCQLYSDNEVVLNSKAIRDILRKHRVRVFPDSKPVPRYPDTISRETWYPDSYFPGTGIAISASLLPTVLHTFCHSDHTNIQKWQPTTK